MKKIFFVVFAVLFIFGCNQKQQNQVETPKKQMIQVEEETEESKKERFAIKNKWLQDLKELSLKVKIKEVTDVYNFLKNDGILGRPVKFNDKRGIQVLEASKSENFVLIVPITKFEPVSNVNWLKTINIHGAVAYFLPEIRSIMISETEKFSSFTRSVILVHEGFHAKSLIIDKKNINNSHYENELGAYNLQIKIFKALGGAKYLKLLNKEKLRFEKRARIGKGKFYFPDMQSYDSEFKKIFGEKLTEKDLSYLNNTLWLDAFFYYIDKSFSKEEGKKIKENFIRTNEQENR